MKYRAEIDGLRAMAVIPVILFHAGVENFSGGFVGVDIFFVISGYLITSIILSEKAQGSFSLVNFYDRRARRILPALFLVMFVSLPFAWFWLFPSDLKDFSQSLVAVSIFSSNILFWQETGYWGVDNELKPLLHTWSLAIEEQYYLLFPLFLLVVWKCRERWVLGSFIFLIVVSLALSQWAAFNMPTANFFLLPTRAWELAIGASIAFYLLHKKPSIGTSLPPGLFSETLAIIGLIFIGFSIVSFNEFTPYPSFHALVPTIGAGLIIVFSSDKTLVGKMLGSKLPVGIGLISYSAYLWHQPLLAFSRHRSLTEPDGLIISLLFVMTFLLAYLSWRYVEKPFRMRGKLSSKTVVIFGVSGSITLIAIGLAGHMTDGLGGLPHKKQLTLELIETNLKANYGLSKTCEGSLTFSSDCRTSDEPEILIWGDSYAMHLIPGIVASNPKVKLVQITKSVCGPFFDIAPVTPHHPVSWARSCLNFTEEVRNWIQSNKTVKYAVVSSLFSQYLSEENRLLSRNGNVGITDIDFVIIEFLKTLDELKSLGVTPVVFSPPPANAMDLGRCLAKAGWHGLNLDECNFEINRLSQARREAYYFLEKINLEYRVIRIDDFICDNRLCRTHLDATWIFRDKGHLSHAGSAALGKKHDFYNLIVDDDHFL